MTNDNERSRLADVAPLAPLLAAVMLLRPPAAPFSYRVIENRRH
jgi:hypothetical protein